MHIRGLKTWILWYYSLEIKYIVFLWHKTQIEIQKALREDPTVYEYDAVYDEMKEKKKAANVKVPEKDRKVHMFIYLFTVKFRK